MFIKRKNKSKQTVFIYFTTVCLYYSSDTHFRWQKLTRPVATISTDNRQGLVTAFLIKYYGCGTGQSLKEPLDTITSTALCYATLRGHYKK